MVATIGSLTKNVSSNVNTLVSDTTSAINNLTTLPSGLMSSAAGMITSQINQFNSLLNKNSSLLKSFSSLTNGGSLGNVLQNLEKSKMLSNATKFTNSLTSNKKLAFTTTSINKIVDSVELPDLTQSVEAIKNYSSEQLTALASKANLSSITNDADLNTALSNITTTTSNFIDNGIKAADTLSSLTKETLTTASNLITDTINTVNATAQTIVDSVGNTVSALVDAAGNVISPIVGLTGNLTNPILDASGKEINPLKEFSTTSFTAAKTLTKTATTLCENVTIDDIDFAELKNSFYQLLRDSLNYCNSTFINALSKCTNFFDQDAKSILRSMVGTLAGKGNTDLYNACLNIIGPGQITDIIGDVTKLASKVTGTTSEINDIKSIIKTSSLDPTSIITSTIPKITDKVPIISTSKLNKITTTSNKVANSLFSKKTVDLVQTVSAAYAS